MLEPENAVVLADVAMERYAHELAVLGTGEGSADVAHYGFVLGTSSGHSASGSVRLSQKSTSAW